jgi:hypothetical protein
MLQEKPSYQRARCRVHKAFRGASHRARVGGGGGGRVGGGGGGGGGEFRCAAAQQATRISRSLYTH